MSSFCILCGGPLEREWAADCRDYYLNTPYRADFFCCSKCGLVQQRPVPRDTARFYPLYPMHLRRSKVHEWASQCLLRQVYMALPDNARRALLFDYGCGDGTYLERVRGKFGAVAGLEPDPILATRVEQRVGGRIYTDSAEALSDLRGKVDCLTAHFVVEHLTDLHSAFGIFSALLKPSGVLHVAVPNICSWEARLFGKKWHGIDAPRHISFPQEEHFKGLACKYGMNLTRCRHALFPNTIAASLTTLLAGRYRHWLFLLLMPLGMCIAALAPSGTLVCEFEKKLKQ